jgi:40S ribosome biogenesis protein Tsr1 and BMS1 C-terminal
LRCGTRLAAFVTFPSAVLKSDTIAAGWRRFQAVPVYATEDANGRLRALKYTPEHMHCSALVWGALAPPNTGGGTS